ncbi:MAG: ArsR family transcriptional regulator [Firmicutes bacterium]|nr:ArsR family transcriptional regulator [Bacillota bacterium]MDY5531575.1 ArsR family transcriptional regulator [Pumilibacteraceae bacterium]
MENEKNLLDKYIGRKLNVRLDRYDKQVAMFSLHDDDIPVAAEVFKALGNEIRLKIIKMTFHGNTRVSEIGKKLNLGNSTVLFHIEVLRKAGLINVDYEPNKKGFVQNVTVKHSMMALALFYTTDEMLKSEFRTYSVEMPVGAYVDARVDDYISYADDFKVYNPNERGIFSPERMNASLLWLSKSGFVEYAFPAEWKSEKPECVEFSLEICSEAPLSRMGWKSEVTFSLDEKELCSYICPHDFGDRRGVLTPAWWKTGGSMYGELIRIGIKRDGVYLNGEKVRSQPSLDLFENDRPDRTLFKVECKKDSEFVGGFNIFGKTFGDYPQNIRMIVTVRNDD